MRNCCPGIDLCRRFVKTYESVIPEPQLGDSLFMSGMLFGGYDDSIKKVIFMSVKEISKKWTMPVRDWGLAYSQFAIFFEDRFAA